MLHLQVSCYFCKREFFRRSGWINENFKFEYKNYCSLKCVGESKKLREVLICENHLCNKKFERRITDISAHNYCSRNCAIVVNNRKFPKRTALIKECLLCGKKFTGDAIKYCSAQCQYKTASIPQEKIIRLITDFYERNDRIPTKREFPHYRVIRDRFGTWNNAIKVAGFEPNPVMFAKRYIANDGHKCDSLSEKIIDDWFYERGIKHEINYPYPGNSRFTVDFKVEDYWIEFFGLNGEHRRYDELKKKKLKLAKKKKLKLIEVYPEHLFPKSILDEVLSALTN